MGCETKSEVGSAKSWHRLYEDKAAMDGGLYGVFQALRLRSGPFSMGFPEEAMMHSMQYGIQRTTVDCF
jgi:hypothetical protein